MKIPSVKYFGLTSQSNVKLIQTIKTSNKHFFFNLEGFFSSFLNSIPDDSCCQDYSIIGEKTWVGWTFVRRFWFLLVQQLAYIL